MLKFAPILLTPALVTMALVDPVSKLPGREPVQASIPGAPPELLMRPLSKAAAIDFNRAIPFSNEPAAPAAPFQLRGDEDALERAAECLAGAVYYEAGSESMDGQRAVAQVILNRVRHPAFPASICEVVFQGFMRPTGCQFTFTCDGSLLRSPQRYAWDRARKLADEALQGAVFAPVGWSTHYHANYVVPYWATSLAKANQVGLHIFYRWPDGSGRAPAFRQAYAEAEGDPAVLRAASLMARGAWTPQRATREDIVDVAPDPRLELAGVLSLLASAPSTSESGYERRIRGYFAAQARHPAVEVLRQRVARVKPIVRAPSIPAGLVVQASLGPPPAVETAPAPAVALDYAGAVRDFAQRSSFAKFFRSERPFYREASAQVENAAAKAAADWEAYTGVAVRPRKATIALRPAHIDQACLLAESDLPRRTLQWLDASRSGASDIFARSGLVETVFERKTGKNFKATALVEDALARAVFFRIAILSRRQRNREMIAAPLERLFAERLRQYEKTRDRYPTLREFLPVLLAEVDDSKVGMTKEAAGAPCIGSGLRPS